MDRQTLGYMKDRVKKSQALIDKIEHLCAYSKHLENARAIGIPRDSGNNTWIGNGQNAFSNYDNTRLLEIIRPAMIQIIADEIAKLEAELASL